MQRGQSKGSYAIILEIMASWWFLIVTALVHASLAQPDIHEPSSQPYSHHIIQKPYLRKTIFVIFIIVSIPTNRRRKKSNLSIFVSVRDDHANSVLCALTWPSWTIEKGMTIPYWDFYGHAVVSDDFIRLTPDRQSKRGSLWNTSVCTCAVFLHHARVIVFLLNTIQD